MSWWFFIRNFEYKFFLTQGTNLGNVNRLVLGKEWVYIKGSNSIKNNSCNGTTCACTWNKQMNNKKNKWHSTIYKKTTSSFYKHSSDNEEYRLNQMNKFNTRTCSSRRAHLDVITSMCLPRCEYQRYLTHYGHNTKS